MTGAKITNRRLGGTQLTRPATRGDFNDDLQECRRGRGFPRCDFVGTASTQTPYAAVDMYTTSASQLGPQACLHPAAASASGASHLPTHNYQRNDVFSSELANNAMSFPITKDNGFTIEAKEMFRQSHGFKCDRQKHAVLADPPTWEPTPPGRRQDVSIATSLHQDGVSPGLTLRKPYWVGAERCMVGRPAPRHRMEDQVNALARADTVLFVETHRLPGGLNRKLEDRRSHGNFGAASTHVMMDESTGRQLGRLTVSEHRPSR